MPGYTRPVEAIDGELAALANLNHDAASQLTSTRAEINKLQVHELNLIAAVDARNRRIDRLLDQRIDSTTTELEQMVKG